MSMRGKKIFFNRFMVFLCALFVSLESVFALVPNVSVAGLKVESKSDDVNIENIGFEDNSITTDAVLKNKNDFVTYKITLKNSDEADYTIESITDDNVSRYVKTSYSSDENIKSGDSANIYVTFKLERLVDKIDDIDDSDFYNLGEVNIEITLLDSNNNSSTINITTNPNTSDNIGFYVKLLLFSVLFIVGAILILRKNKKAFRYLIIVGLLLVVVPTYAMQKYNIDLVFSKNNIKVKVDTYKITVVDTDTEIKNISNLDYTLDVEEPNIPGYTFDGWSDEDDGDVKYNNGDVINTDQDIELYPSFSIIHYSLTYDTNGADNINLPTDYTILDELIIPNLTKSGYTFDGWTGSNGTTKQKDVKIEKGSIGEKEFMAHFTINTYSIKFHDTASGNDILVNKTYHSVLSNEDTPTVSKTGYTFEYWSLQPDGQPFDFDTPIEEDMTLYSVFKVTTNVVTLNDNNVSKEVKVDYGSTLTAEDLSSNGKTGYIFKYWQTENGEQFDPNTPITGPISLIAVYEKATYTITYDKKDGTAPVVINYQVDSEDISLPNPRKDGYEFIGWDNGDGSNPEKDVVIKTGSTGDINYVAKYSVINYDVELNLGTGTTNMTYNVESEINLPIPNREGYLFKGWSYESGAITEDFTSSQKTLDISKAEQGKIKLYAVWEKIDISISTNDDLTDFVAGNKITLNSTVTPNYLSDQVVWTSSNNNIATVNNGVVTGVSEGDVVITATVKGVSASINIPVKKAVAYLPSTKIFYSSLQKGVDAVSPSAVDEEDKKVELLVNTSENIDVVQGRKVSVDLKGHTLNGYFWTDYGTYANIHSSSNGGSISNPGGVGVWVTGKTDVIGIYIKATYGILATDADRTGSKLKDENGNFLTGSALENALADRATANVTNCTVEYGENFGAEVRFDSTINIFESNFIGTGTSYLIPNLVEGGMYTVEESTGRLAGRIYVDGVLQPSS